MRFFFLWVIPSSSENKKFSLKMRKYSFRKTPIRDILVTLTYKYIKGVMESLNPEFALYGRVGSNNERPRSDHVT